MIGAMSFVKVTGRGGAGSLARALPGVMPAAPAAANARASQRTERVRIIEANRM
jgi:hypothetical protein